MQPPSEAIPVAVTGVTVAFGRDLALREVSLDVPTGQTLAILGANGSGKSTLVRAILGLVPLSGGAVEIFGSPVTARARRRPPWHRVGYVPQRTTAAGGVGACVGEVVAAGLLTEIAWRPPRHARERVSRALATVGLEHVEARAVTSLSGGQQQRVLIARALVRAPDLLILDEPLAGIDAENQDAIARALDDMGSRGGTVILVLHEPGVLAPLVDRAIVLDHGCITLDGPPPAEVGAHALPGHDHVHPHAPGTPGAPSLNRGVS